MLRSEFPPFPSTPATDSVSVQSSASPQTPEVYTPALVLFTPQTVKETAGTPQIVSFDCKNADKLEPIVPPTHGSSLNMGKVASAKDATARTKDDQSPGANPATLGSSCYLYCYGVPIGPPLPIPTPASTPKQHTGGGPTQSLLSTSGTTRLPAAAARPMNDSTTWPIITTGSDIAVALLTIQVQQLSTISNVDSEIHGTQDGRAVQCSATAIAPDVWEPFRVCVNETSGWLNADITITVSIA